MSVRVQQYNSNTHVVKPWKRFLKIALPEIMKTPRVYCRDRFARHPPPHSRCLCHVRRPSCVGRAFARGVLPGAFVRALDLGARASKSSANARTHICRACTISQSITRTIIRLLAGVLSPKNPFLHSVQTDWRLSLIHI